MEPTAKLYGPRPNYGSKPKPLRQDVMPPTSEVPEINEENIPHPKRHNLEPFTDSSKTRKLRFWLNIIFMVGAIVGLVTYFYYDTEVAKYILIVSCAFKFVELVLRILKI